MLERTIAMSHLRAAAFWYRSKGRASNVLSLSWTVSGCGAADKNEQKRGHEQKWGMLSSCLGASMRRHQGGVRGVGLCNVQPSRMQSHKCWKGGMGAWIAVKLFPLSCLP